MNDDRYITEEYDNGIKVTMKVYKEWVDENGEATVYHKTDREGFKSPLVKEDYEWYYTSGCPKLGTTQSLYATASDIYYGESFIYYLVMLDSRK